jgi:HEAT repeat protein
MEWAREMIVLLRSAGHRIGKVRAFSPDCELDAGGLRVVWLSGVNSADSVRVLSRLVTERESETDSGQPVVEGALAAIAMHGDEAADQALASFAAADRPEKLRSHAAFWLGSARGMPGLRVLEGMAKTDPSDRVRQQVAFAFSVSGEARAVDDLIRMAHEDGSGRVRGQALFWLAQKAGHRAAQAISDAIENDPDTETKRSAVFALYNMPHDEGIPLLIQVARTNRNREVRKQAFFWLGQTKDPRALAFFEEVLGR